MSDRKPVSSAPGFHENFFGGIPPGQAFVWMCANYHDLIQFQKTWRYDLDPCVSVLGTSAFLAGVENVEPASCLWEYPF